ncbi:lipopolysaccharide biosynthesis protein [Celeribacter sp.]|uniref:lipopolysaccharide biosynthesis protein n=1 Tax=Celeribacter sp. TaxID=1890673 RepID=UPI003A8FF6F8
MTSFIIKIATVFTGRMAARGAQFFTFLALAHELSPSQFGAYGLLITSVLLASLLGSIGLRQASAQWIGVNKITHAHALGTLLALLPVLGVISAFAVWCVVGSQISAHGVTPGGLIVFVAVAGSMATMMFQGILLGLGRTTAFSLSDSLYPFSLLGLVLLLRVLTPHIELLPVVASVAIAQTIAGLLTFVLAWRGSDKIALQSSRQVIHLVKHGLAYSVNLFLITLSARISLYFIQTMISQDAVGQFFAGQRIGDLLIEAATAVGLVLFSDGVRSKDPQATLRRNARIAGTVLWIFSLAGLLFSIFAPQITALLLSDEYGAAGHVLTITAWMIAPASATKMIYPAIAAMGKPILGSPAILAAIVTNILFCWALIPSYGLSGAAFALVSSQYVLLIGYAIILRRSFNIAFKDSLLPSLPVKRKSK